MIKQKPSVLITGASRGLGLAVAKALEDSCCLILSSRFSEEEFIDKVGAQLKYFKYVKIDFSLSPEEFILSIKKIEDVSILIHNASPYTEVSFFSETIDQIIQFGIFSINATLLFRQMNEFNCEKFIYIGSSAVDHQYTLYAGGEIYRQHKCSLYALCLEIMKHEKKSSIIINPGLISANNICSDDEVHINKVVFNICLGVYSSDLDGKICNIYPKSFHSTN